MEAIAGAGRTIFFVSHNMNAVRSLCSRAVEIRDGKLVADGPTDEVVRGYIASQTAAGTSTELKRPLGNENELTITAARVLDAEGNAGGPFHTRDPLIVEIEFDVYRANDAYEIGFDLLAEGGLVFREWHTLASPDRWPPMTVGRNVFRCVIPAGLLNEGRYAVAPRAGVHLVHWIVNGDDAIWFEVIKDHSDSPFFWVRHPGPIAPVLDWSAESSDAPIDL
jgi:lipopolysaccharide transport system ATP-binding protein